MILSTRIFTYVAIVVIISSEAKSSCYIQNTNNDKYCPGPYMTVFDCESTVTYKYDPLQCRARIEYDHNIRINLAHPDENPFVVNTNWYKELNIYDGYLVTVPEDVYNMTKLTHFELTKNKLRKINLNHFLTLPMLKVIDLSNNKIIVIDTNEQNASKTFSSSVQRINLSFNFIEDVPNNFVKRFNGLEHLNMSYNMISSVGKHAFEGTEQLKTLDLSHNKLYNVDNIFAQLPKLMDLNYAANKNLQKLSKLVLDSNHIANINFTEFFETGISELSIGDNRIPCDEMARVKYSKFSEKFDHIVTASVFNMAIDYVNGIPCVPAKDETRTLYVSDNKNSSLLISSLKNAVESNSKSVDTIFDIVNGNEKKLEQIGNTTNYMLAQIYNELKEIKNQLNNSP